jgi:ABC-type transporter Mla subunit MlaD
MPTNPSFDDIVNIANAAMASLQAMAQNITNQMLAVQAGRPYKQMPAADQATVDALSAKLDEVNSAYAQLGRTTAMALDQTAQVQALIAGLKQTQANLNAAAGGLAQFAATVNGFANLVSSVATLVQKLQALGTS